MSPQLTSADIINSALVRTTITAVTAATTVVTIAMSAAATGTIVGATATTATATAIGMNVPPIAATALGPLPAGPTMRIAAPPGHHRPGGRPMLIEGLQGTMITTEGGVMTVDAALIIIMTVAGTGKTEGATRRTTVLMIGLPGTGMLDGPVEVENPWLRKNPAADQTGRRPAVGGG